MIYLNGENTITQSFSNGALTSLTQSNPSAGVIDTYNEMGFLSVSKNLNFGYEYRHFYDQMGNLKRMETWVNSVLQSYTELTYDTNSQQGKASILLKGHPRIPTVFGSNANLTKQITNFTKKIVGNDFKKSSEVIYDYDFNSSGYYTEMRRTSNYYDNNEQLSSTSKDVEKLVYQGCK